MKAVRWMIAQWRMGRPRHTQSVEPVQLMPGDTLTVTHNLVVTNDTQFPIRIDGMTYIPHAKVGYR